MSEKVSVVVSRRSELLAVVILTAIAIWLGGFVALSGGISLLLLIALAATMVMLGLVVWLKWSLKLLVLISLGQFLFQQLALYAGISDTRLVTVIPYTIAAAIYGGMAIRYMSAPRWSIRVRSLRFGDLQDCLLVGLLTLSVLQIFNPAIPLSAGVMGFLMGPYWIGFFFVGRHVLKGDEKLALLLLRLIVIMVACAAVYGLVGLVVEYPWTRAYLESAPDLFRALHTYRMGSSIGLPPVSGLAGMLGFLTALSLSLAQRQRRWLLTATAGFALLLTVASGTRSAILGAVVGMASIIWFRKLIVSFRMLVIVIVIIVPVLVGVQSKMTTYTVERLETFSLRRVLSGDILQEESVDVRFATWSKAISEIAQRPLGRGTGSWHQATTFDRKEVGMVVDNEYLALTGELGFLGLFLYLAFVASLSWQCWRALCSRRAREEGRSMWAMITMSTLMGVSTMAIAIHPLYTFPSTMMVWLLWGMGSRFMQNANPVKGH
jgi:hypothetical protein